MFVALTYFLFQKGSTVSAAGGGGFLLLFCPSHSWKTGSPYIFSLSTAIKTGDAFSFSIITKLSPTDDAALPPQSYMCDDDVQQEAYIIREIYIYNIYKRTEYIYTCRETSGAEGKRIRQSPKKCQRR